MKQMWKNFETMQTKWKEKDINAHKYGKIRKKIVKNGKKRAFFAQKDLETVEMKGKMCYNKK